MPSRTGRQLIFWTSQYSTELYMVYRKEELTIEISGDDFYDKLTLNKTHAKTIAMNILSAIGDEDEKTPTRN